MGAALHGNLKDFGIAEVFQLIGQQRKTGVLEIAGPDKRVQLAFDEGAVVWASPVADGEFAVLGDRLVRCGLVTRPRLQELMRESNASARALPTLLVSSGAVAQADLDEINELLSRETIFDVMRWTGGSFHFDAQPVHHDIAPDKLLAAEQILMDGLRMLDEWQTFHVLVPDEEMVFEPVGQLETYRQQVSGDARSRSDGAERIFQLVDGRLTVRRIIDLSRLGTFEATRILADLHSANMIRPVTGKAARRAAKPERERKPILERIQVAAAAVLPLVLLAGLVWVGFAGRGAPTHLEGHPVPSSPLAQVRQDFELRRLRHAIETHRMVAGAWPERLEASAGAGGRSPFASESSAFALTDSETAPYYYRQREGGILLLAPTR